MANLPEAGFAVERINRKVQTLDFMKSHLVELSKMAASEKLDMLCYLIEMAVAEAGAVIVDRKAHAAVKVVPSRQAL